MNNAQNSPYWSGMTLGDNTRRPLEIYYIKTLSGIIRFIDINLLWFYIEVLQNFATKLSDKLA